MNVDDAQHLAFGLACGAHAVHVEVRDGDDWRRVLDHLLAERGSGPNDLAMDLRWEATVVRTVPPDLTGWQRLVHQAAEHGRIGHDDVPALLAVTERITRYEDCFRADGLIPPHGVVHGIRAYDWGRAVTVARLGPRAGYCDDAAAERAILRAGELCARHYMSWADLSAAFGLGHLLSLADVPANYIALRQAQRRLLTEDGSPWRTVPWAQMGGFRQVDVR